MAKIGGVCRNMIKNVGTTKNSRRGVFCLYLSSKCCATHYGVANFKAPLILVVAYICNQKQPYSQWAVFGKCV